MQMFTPQERCLEHHIGWGLEGAYAHMQVNIYQSYMSSICLHTSVHSTSWRQSSVQKDVQKDASRQPTHVVHLQYVVVSALTKHRTSISPATMGLAGGAV